MVGLSKEDASHIEVVVPLASRSGFAHLWRDNDSQDLHSNGPSIIDRSVVGFIGKVDAISIVQANNFGTAGLGELNVIVRSVDKLKFFWQEDRGDHPWHGPYPLPGTGLREPLDTSVNATTNHIVPPANNASSPSTTSTTLQPTITASPAIINNQ